MTTASAHFSIACCLKQLYVRVSTDHSFPHSAAHLGGVECTHTNINKCTDCYILHKNFMLGFTRVPKEEVAQRICQCLQENFIFKTVWKLFDIQSGCVKAAAVIGTRNQESIELKHLERRRRVNKVHSRLKVLLLKLCFGRA